MLSKLKTALEARVRLALVPLLFRFPPAGLRPDRLAIYLKALIDRAHMDGDVAEIGCDRGGVSIYANRALKASGWTGTYTCYDTFGGFVKEQFEADRQAGISEVRRNMFADNSEELIRKIFDYHRSSDIQTVAGDIAKAGPEKFSAHYIAALIDVDLSIPTYEGLKRIYPRLLEGGIICVDDCEEGDNWKARSGYQRFTQESGLREKYDHGLGIVTK
jgi:hypothetical protein